MQRRRLQRKVGQWLAIWCAVFGMLHIVWIQSFTVTVVPSVSGLDTPDAPVTVFSVAFGILLLLVAGLAANLSNDQPSALTGRFSALKHAALLLLSVAAIARVVLGVPGIVSGDASVMAIVAEIWFAVAGVAGILLWVTLLRRKRDLQS